MDLSNINKSIIEQVVRQVIMENLVKSKDPSGVASVKLQNINVDESNRLDTGNPSHIVYTKDLFTLEESPRLGMGIMEMKNTTFDWTLNYDEVDYIIQGHLDIIVDGRKTSADAGELIFIPKGSKIQFSVPDYARFLYVTYPADWATQG